MTRVVDAVVLDFGGVFTDSPFEALRVMGEAQGAAFDVALEVVFGPYDDDTDHPWHRAERGELTLEGARDEIRVLGQAQGMEVDLFEFLQSMAANGGGLRAHVIERTRQLREAGLGTALVTNNLTELRELWRAMLPLDELFDVVIDSSEVGVRKPDPRIFELALAELGGVAPDRSAFLDDYPGNVVAAQRLGMHGIVVGVDPAAALAELAILTGVTGPDEVVADLTPR